MKIFFALMVAAMLAPLPALARVTEVHTFTGRPVPVDISYPDLVVDGVTWAATNIDSNQTRAARPDMYTRFYQFNSDTSYAASGDITPWTKTVIDEDADWSLANSPCPADWRLPTHAEIAALHNAGHLWVEAGQRGAAVAGMFYGPNHPSCLLPSNMDGCVFLPAGGYRSRETDGALTEQGIRGHYWSSEQKISTTDNTTGWKLTFSSPNNSDPEDSYNKAHGLNIRCVR